jgi:hypothetical protein
MPPNLAASEDAAVYLSESTEREEPMLPEVMASVNAAVYMSEYTKRKAEDLLFDEVFRKIKSTKEQQTTPARTSVEKAGTIGKCNLAVS